MVMKPDSEPRIVEVVEWYYARNVSPISKGIDNIHDLTHFAETIYDSFSEEKKQRLKSRLKHNMATVYDLRDANGKEVCV
jgi:hypothetical protein